MKRMIALLLLLCMLTACAAPVPETEEPTAASQEIAVPEQKQPDSGTMTGAATFTQAASEPLTYTVVLKTLEDSAAAADGTTLAVRSYELPEMTVTLPDGTVLTEAASPAETAALERAEAFNSRFRDWAGADGFDEGLGRGGAGLSDGVRWELDTLHAGAGLFCLSDGADGVHPGGVLQLYRRGPPQHGTAGLELRPDDGPVLRA